MRVNNYAAQLPHFSRYLLVNVPFTDVAADAWYGNNVAFAYANGLFSGTTDTTFAPDTAMTRGMLVTVLWRMENKPAAVKAANFTDVAADAYYAKAIAWANEKGVVKGYGDTFGPNDPITREQMAAVLYRYAQLKGYDVSVGEDTNILSYTDAMNISEYAIPAMQWACGAGLVSGDGTQLMPLDSAARAQVAAILERFIESVVK